MPRARLHRGDRERGSVSLFFVMVTLALLVIIGLVVDGGAQIRNRQRADTSAQEAARAAGQAVNPAAAINGDGAQLQLGTAQAAAQQYLASAGVQGNVTTTGGTTVHVHVHTTTTYSPSFLGVIGVGSLSASADADVRVVRQLGGER